jgi:hypothetical protein
VGVGYWSLAHIVEYGKASTNCTTAGCTTGDRNFCPVNYQVGPGATLQSNCQIHCGEGYYVASFGGACICCGADGYRTGDASVNYGSVNTCGVCAAGTKTGGCGKEASAVTDCVPYMTLRNTKNLSQNIVIRSVRDVLTEMRLAVDGGTLDYYGNINSSPVPGSVELESGDLLWHVSDSSSEYSPR